MANEKLSFQSTTESANSGAPAAPSVPVNASARRSGAWWITPVLIVVGIAVLSLVWLVAAPQKRFDDSEFYALAAAGRLNSAERMLRDHLTYNPKDAHAHFLLAELLLERPDRADPGARVDDATEALEHLAVLPDGGGFKKPDNAANRALYRGKAARVLKRWDSAEQEWKNALRLNPQIPEAGLGLLDLYYVEVRRREARSLALQLFESEPDPRDRALIMTALLFQDAVKPDAKSLVPILEAVTQAEPNGLQAHIAYGLSLVRDNEHDRGIAVLERVLQSATESTDDESPRLVALEGLLTGLDLSSRHETVAELLANQPSEWTHAPRLERFVGLAAQTRQDWPAAVEAYKAALAFDPTDSDSRSRLAQVLRMSGQVTQAEEMEAAAIAHRQAAASLLALHDEVAVTPGMGVVPYVDLAERVARAYDAMGRAPEATAWRKIGAGQADAS